MALAWGYSGFTPRQVSSHVAVVSPWFDDFFSTQWNHFSIFRGSILLFQRFLARWIKRGYAFHIKIHTYDSSRFRKSIWETPRFQENPQSRLRMTFRPPHPYLFGKRSYSYSLPKADGAVCVAGRADFNLPLPLPRILSLSQNQECPSEKQSGTQIPTQYSLRLR